MIVIGLTGSIGMGKSTTAQMFSDEGLEVWNADLAIEKLYKKQNIIDKIADTFPGLISDKALDRQKMRALFLKNPEALSKLENIIHPFVKQDMTDFIANSKGPIVVLDVPLLFETGLHKHVDKVIVVTVPFDVQKARVMDRGKMTKSQFISILSRQLPDVEKRRRADYVIDTQTFSGARSQVRHIISDLTHA